MAPWARRGGWRLLGVRPRRSRGQGPQAAANLVSSCMGSWITGWDGAVVMLGLGVSLSGAWVGPG